MPKEIESGKADGHLQKMIEHYGKERLDQMSPEEFYQNYKKVS